MIWTIVLYVFVGFLSGIFGGLGMGGGTILIPILSIFLGFEQKLSQGINLLSFVVMALFSLIIHYKNGFIETKGVFYIILSGVVFSGIGAFLAGVISSEILRMAFGIFLCILAVIQLLKVLNKSKKF